MIPPCDPSILDKNPQFKKLHQHLTTNLLNPDTSTKADGDIPEQKAVAEVRCNPTIVQKLHGTDGREYRN